MDTDIEDNPLEKSYKPIDLASVKSIEGIVVSSLAIAAIVIAAVFL